MSMSGIPSLIANRGPQRMQIRDSPSRRKGALPSGQTRSAKNSSIAMTIRSFVLVGFVYELDGAWPSVPLAWRIMRRFPFRRKGNSRRGPQDNPLISDVVDVVRCGGKR